MYEFKPQRRSFTRLPLVLGLAAACLAALPSSFGQAPANYTLRWSDNFAGTPTLAGTVTVDTNKWWYRMGHSAYSSQLPTNISLDGAGNMDIANLTQTVPTISSYTGGGLISQTSFRYGYFQVKARTPADSGWHTAFWLSSLGAPNVSWNPAPAAIFTEIDGFEVDSQTSTKVSTGWLAWTGSDNTAAARCNAYIYPGFDTSAALHTYGIEWTETGITYYIDGSVVCGPQSYTSTQGAASPVNIWLTSIAYTTPITTPAGAQATFAAPEYFVRDYYLNAEDTGYAEYGSNWGTSGVSGFSSQPVRYTCTAGQSALYTPNLLATGSYDLQFYQVVSSTNMDTATAISINTSSGPVTGPALPTTGSSRWVDLGVYTFAAGSGASVSLQNGNNCLRTSMMKFVYQ